MPLARWFILLASLSIVLPAQAQHRKVRLSPQAKALVEATREETTGCTEVYRWDRCKEPRPAARALTRPDPERRRKCIISARNVAAKRGATHFTLRGPVVTGFRCASKAPPTSPTQAALPANTPTDKVRYQALGFVPWGGACVGIDELFTEACALRPSIQGQVSCRERRARALLEGERLYYLPKLKTRVDFDRASGVYTLQFLGVLGRLGATRSDQRYLTVGPLEAARRGTTTDALADLARPFASVSVSKASLKAPKRFKRDLVVEALVRPKALHAPVANNPARITALEVEVVGLRAFVPDLSWGEVVIRAPGSVPTYRCRPLEPGF